LKGASDEVVGRRSTSAGSRIEWLEWAPGASFVCFPREPRFCLVSGAAFLLAPEAVFMLVSVGPESETNFPKKSYAPQKSCTYLYLPMSLPFLFFSCPWSLVEGHQKTPTNALVHVQSPSKNHSPPRFFLTFFLNFQTFFSKWSFKTPKNKSMSKMFYKQYEKNSMSFSPSFFLAFLDISLRGE
jgi:hypothetical protein